MIAPSLRIERSGRTAALLVGDLLGVALFVAAGELRHGGTILDGTATFLQFGLAWLLVGTVLGAFGTEAISTRRRAVAITGVGWVLATGVGQLFRAIVKPGFYVAPSFVAVTAGVGGALLVGWRLLAAEWLRRRS